MPKVFQNDRPYWQKVALVIAGVGVLLSFIFLLGGAWGPSIGVLGLLMHLVTAMGFLVFGTALGCVFVVFVADVRKDRRSKALDDGFDRWLWLKELGAIALNVLVYGGAFLLSMGALSSLDGARMGQILVVATVWIVCVATVVLYRRHRKRHRIAYDAAGPMLMIAFCGAMSLLCAYFVVDSSRNVLADFLQGPRTEVCTLSDVERDRPSRRYGALRQTMFSFEFATTTGEIVRVEVAYDDAPALQNAIDAAEVGEEVRLTFYSHSLVFVSAEPVRDF